MINSWWEMITLPKGRKADKKPVTLSARSRSTSPSLQRSCRLGEQSTYLAERGRKCSNLSTNRGTAGAVEVCLSININYKVIIFIVFRLRFRLKTRTLAIL